MTPEKRPVRLDPGLEILSERLQALEVSCVIATIVSASGSTYRKPGARMLIEANGRITGLLSGGCLEQDLREHATAVLASGVARAVTYDMRADNDLVFGIGAGCEGCVGILLEVCRRDSPVARAITLAADLSWQGEASALVVMYGSPTDQCGTYLWGASEPRRRAVDEVCALAIENACPVEHSWMEPSGLHTAWIQPVLPLPAILICGGGPDAEPLAAAFRALHYPVTVADHRPANLRADNFPGATRSLGPPATVATRLDLARFFAAVVMSHHLASDVHYLRVLATTGLRYIGVLGPATRRARLLAELGKDAAAIEGRLRGPIGLDIGAVTPEGIALAIAAEIHAVASDHNAQPFKQRFTFAADQDAGVAMGEVPAG